MLRLGKAWGTGRLENACARALLGGARSYRHVESILKHGLDAVPPDDAAPDAAPLPSHENVRGPEYYS